MSVSKTLMRKSFMIGARYSGLTKLARPFLSGQGAILMLHRVGKPQNRSGINSFLSVDGGFLHDLLEALKADRYLFVTLDEAVDRIKAGHSDEKYLTVTLDDGYRDNLLTAAPIFAKFEVPYTIYACTGFCSGEAFLWWEIIAQIIEKNEQVSVNGALVRDCKTAAEKRSAYRELTDYFCTQVDEKTQRDMVLAMARENKIDPFAHCRSAVMGWSDLRKAAADPLCSIEAHTVYHYHLARLSEDEALEEMVKSADFLEAELGTRPKHFAYPYGGEIAAGHRETKLARRAGFVSAVTTRHGLLQSGHETNLHALPRISLNGDYQQLHYVETMLSGITVPVANRGKKFVTIGDA